MPRGANFRHIVIYETRWISNNHFGNADGHCQGSGISAIPIYTHSCHHPHIADQRSGRGTRLSKGAGFGEQIFAIYLVIFETLWNMDSMKLL